MLEIIWDKKFKKIYRSWSKKRPDLVGTFKDKMELFVNNPFHPSLRTHSLSGILKELWSLRITYEYRLIFKFIGKRKKKVLLIHIGTHQEVY
jgi:addiction module RelE/StbE family toxin